MNKRHEHGVVLAFAAPDQNDPQRKVTVYWQGPGANASLWSPMQQRAARFVDEPLAWHTLRTVSSAVLDHGRVWVESALHPRNGGPARPIITETLDGTAVPDRPEPGPEAEQGALFGGDT